MKFKALALVGALLATPVVAQPIYIDIGADYGGNANFVGDTNKTGWLEELQFNYNSWSTVLDVNDNLDVDAGDIITSTGGLLGSGFTDFNALYGNNTITSFLPKQFGTNGGPSNNGYGTAGGWELSFGFNNLTGVIDAFGGVNWISGTISMYVTTDVDSCINTNSAGCFTRMFDLEVTNGGNIPSATILSGYLNNFNTTDNINAVLAGDIFNTMFGGNNMSFRDIHDLLALQGKEQNFKFLVDQDVAALPGVDSYDAGSKTFTLKEALHDGSLAFDVPEPTSIAILGLGLLGLGLSRRKQA